MLSLADFSDLEAARLPIIHVPAGGNIYCQADRLNDVFNILSGWAYLYQILEDGRRQILHFALPGSLLGIEPAGHNHMNHGVEAQTDVLLCVIPRANLAVLREQHPDLNNRYLWLVERDEALAYDHMTSLGRRTAKERVAHLLLELACRVRKTFPLAAGDLIELPVTQAVMGDALGLTAVHVNRTLRVLKDEGVAEFRRQKLRIIDAKRLTATASVSEEMMSLWTAADEHRPVHSPKGQPLNASLPRTRSRGSPLSGR